MLLSRLDKFNDVYWNVYYYLPPFPIPHHLLSHIISRTSSISILPLQRNMKVSVNEMNFEMSSLQRCFTSTAYFMGSKNKIRLSGVTPKRDLSLMKHAGGLGKTINKENVLTERQSKWGGSVV